MEDEAWDYGVLIMLRGMKEEADEKEERETGKKKVGKAARVIPPRWISENIVPPRRLLERIQQQNVEVSGQSTPQKRTSERIAEQTVESPVARSIPQKRISERIEEQIIEVPTLHGIPPSRISQRIEEQTVNVRRAKGIPQERISEPIEEQIIEGKAQIIPQERISKRIRRQTVDVPVPCTPAPTRGGNSSSAAAPLNSAEWLGNRGFRTFSPEEKSATTMCESSAALGAHPSSRTPAAYELENAAPEEEEEDPTWWIDEHGRRWYWLDDAPGRWYLLGTNFTVFCDEPCKGGGPTRRR